MKKTVLPDGLAPGTTILQLEAWKLLSLRPPTGSKCFFYLHQKMLPAQCIADVLVYLILKRKNEYDRQS
jgi:hypothetical protein